MTKKIDELFSRMHTDNIYRKFSHRYPKAKLLKYQADLIRVLKMVDDGNTMPSWADLKAHFEESYGIVVSEGSIKRHLLTLQRGKKLWV